MTEMQAMNTGINFETLNTGIDFLDRLADRLLLWLGLDSWLPVFISLLAIFLVLVLRRPLARVILTALTFSRRTTEGRRADWRTTLQKPFSWFLTAAVIHTVFKLYMPLTAAGIFLGQVAASFFLAAVFWMMLKLAELIIEDIRQGAELRGRQLDRTAMSYLETAVKAVLVIAAVFSILSRWMENLMGLVASVGIGGLVIALAAQDTASNLFASIAILLDKPFSVGDWVTVEGVSGGVEKVGLRSTHIRQADKTLVSLPNSKIGNAIVKNVTRRESQLIAFTLNFDPATPAAMVRNFLDEAGGILETAEGVDAEGRMVRFDQLSHTGCGVTIRYFTAAAYADMMDTRERVNLAMLEAAEHLGLRLATSAITVYYGPSSPRTPGPGETERGTE